MGRFNASEIDNYGQSSSGGSFFSLKNDKDAARVRFMYDSVEDIEGFAVHRVPVGDKEKYVNCLRDYNDPVDKCPFCQAKYPQQAKIFVPLYNEDAEKIQFWERGKTFYSQLSGLCSRYPHIVSRMFDIERNGKPKDPKTTYNFYPVNDADGTTVQDILDDCQMDELPSPLGTIILDKSYDEMLSYVETGDFGSAVAPRKSAQASEELPRRSSRRTPANGDRF